MEHRTMDNDLYGIERRINPDIRELAINLKQTAKHVDNLSRSLEFFQINLTTSQVDEVYRTVHTVTSLPF
jgi:hypothetical protein